MTPQTKLVALGAAVTVGSRFLLKKEWQTALIFGLGAIAAVAILLAHEDKP